MTTFKVWIVRPEGSTSDGLFFRNKRRAEHFVECNPGCLIAEEVECTEDAWLELAARESGEYVIH